MSRESGLVEFKQATDLAIENLATQGLEFSGLQPGEVIFRFVGVTDILASDITFADG